MSQEEGNDAAIGKDLYLNGARFKLSDKRLCDYIDTV
jgi:hypothetical protein